MKVLSIVAPMYNMSPWLAVALESCLWQTRREVEVLVVDDGSTDNGREIAERYAALDSRIRVVAQANAGVGAARQRGQDEASGDFITFLDADDFLAPEAARLWLEAARDGSELVCGNAVAFSDRTRNARRYFPHPAAAGLRYDSARRYWKSKVLWRWAISLPMLRRADIRHAHFKLGQDALYMFSALLEARSFSQVGPDLYYFRQDHKNAKPSLETLVEHGFAHFIEARRILLAAPDGRGVKPLVKYLNENYWRDLQKAARRLEAPDAAWEGRIIALALTLFEGLDPQWFKAGYLTPDLKEQTAFLPFVEAAAAGDEAGVGAIFASLRRKAEGAALPPDKGNAFHSLRLKCKAFFNARAWRARLLLRRLEALAAARKGVPRPSLRVFDREGR